MRQNSNNKRFKENKNWRKQFPDLTNQEIRIAVLITLEGLPNNSSTLSKLPTQVLKILSIRTKQKPRKEFERKVKQCIRYLKDQKVIEIYTVKNERIKLLPNYESYLIKSYKNYFPSETDSPKSDFITPNEPDEENFSKTINMDIPELEDDSPFEPPEKLNSNEQEDGDTLDKIFLENENKNDLKKPNYLKTKKVVVTNKSILNFMEKEICCSKIEKIKANQHILELKYLSNVFINKVEVCAYIATNQIEIRFLIDYLEDVAVDILKYWRQVENNISVCIQSNPVESFYLIHKKVIVKDPDLSIISLYSEMEKHALFITKLISSHL